MMMRARIGWPSPAMVVATIALIVASSGTTLAAVEMGARASREAKVIPSRNTVGPRQLKSNAVLSGKIKNNAITAAKVRDRSLTGAEINLAALGTVPEAAHAQSAGDAATLGGHSAACPGATAPIRGVCFDSQPNPPVSGVEAAADACAAKGGWLPTPLALRSTRSVINLGTGIGAERQLTDSFYANTSGGAYRTIVVQGNGTMTEVAPGTEGRYVCAYPLLR
jgi:hypothetical protein